jgi:Darcynin, domain of unknown function
MIETLFQLVKVLTMTAPATTSHKPMTIFWMVKTTPAWLNMPALGEGGRFDYVEKVLKPIIGKHRGAQLRFFDVEAFSAVCTDVMIWEVCVMADYNALVETLRETKFWDTYFQVIHILPSFEDGYADHYQQERVGANGK